MSKYLYGNIERNPTTKEQVIKELEEIEYDEDGWYIIEALLKHLDDIEIAEACCAVADRSS